MLSASCINLGCGRKLVAAPPDWLNVDVIPLEEHPLRNLIISGPYSYCSVDLFAYPWPWGDESVEHFRAEHFLEHIPHTPRFSEWALDPRNHRYRQMDGFFAFFAEVWRCLKPGGTITAECPWVTSYEQFSDPTHTRAVMPKTLATLGNTQTIVEDYRLPFAFTWDGLATYGVDEEFRGLSLTEALERANRFWNVIHTWRFTLTKAPLPKRVHPADRLGGTSWIVPPTPAALAAAQTEGVK